MSARGIFLTLFGGLTLSVASGNSVAQPMERPPIEAQKEALQKEREAIAAIYAQAARQCWQRFMVNDCLHTARLQRRQALIPVEKQEQALNAAQRAWSVIQRQERLDGKQPESQAPHDLRP